jgi:hypothetical protein
MAAELYLMELGDGRFSILLCNGSVETQLPPLTPAELLISFSELDYTDYRKVVRWLRDEHPLFEERIDIPVADLEDFVAEAILLTPDLHEIDPVSGFVVTDILHRILQTEDDGTAMLLLTAGQQVLRVMEEPLRVQNYLRNIMDVTFDSTAGASPAEQYEKLREAYSDIAQVCDPAKLPQQEENRVFQIRNLFGLRLLVLALYFEQDNQRICRCDYCWGYFIPKTKKVTRYCDRMTDGQSCKQRGANLARLEKTSEDEALLICKKLRDRMYARLLRWQDAAPSEREQLIPMDYQQYHQWSENARLAREAYVLGALTAEEFLRKIDTTHELASYEAGKAKLSDGPSIWQQLVARDFRFDSERYFPEKMAYLNLDLSDPAPQWQILTADDLRKEAQKGHQSLREKYGKG